MALAANAVFEVRTTGHADNAGYFNPAGASPGTDFSQQDDAEIVIDGATITATVHTTTTQINITGATVASTWNRNGLRITGGTATAGLYEITSVDVGNNRITVDRSAGSSTQTVVGRIGGAMAHPSQAAADNLFSNAVWIKEGTYDVTEAITFTSGGAAGSSNVNIHGYGTTRGDSGRPTLLATSGTNYTILNQNSAGMAVTGIIVDGDGRTGVQGINLSSRGFVRNCLVRGCSLGVNGSSADQSVVTATLVEDCTEGIQAGNIRHCTVRNCTSHGITAYGLITDSLIYGNGGDGVNMSANTIGSIVGCIIHGNTGNGIGAFFRRAGGAVRDCIITSNGGWGIQWQNSPGIHSRNVTGCFFRENTSGISSVTGLQLPFLDDDNTTLTADPYENASGDNFNINDTAGGGALIRAVQRSMT